MLNRLLPFTRSKTSAPTSYQRVAKPLRVDGQLQSIGTVRSSFQAASAEWITSIVQSTNADFPDEALASVYLLGTAHLAINARASFAADIPIHVVDQRGRVVEDSPAAGIVRQSQRLIWRAMAWKLIIGRIHWRKRFNPFQYPSGLTLLNSLDVQPIVLNGNQLIGYRVNDGVRWLEFKPQALVSDYTFHPFSDTEGASALESAMLRVNIEINAGRFGSSFFANSARPDVVITTEQALSPDQQKEAAEKFTAKFKGVRNAFRAFFAGGGKWTVTPITPPLTDLAMPELVNQADVKICAAIGINPVLVGIGSAKDALSAQGTYREIKQNHIDNVAIGDARWFCNMLNEGWLCVDFPDSAERWHLEPDIAAIQSDARGTGDRITAATGATMQHVWTVNEARDYTGKQPLPGVLQINPDWATTAYQAGGLTLTEYRAALGYQQPYKVDGLIWELDPRAKGQPTTANTFSMAFPPRDNLPPSEPPKGLPSGTSEPPSTPQAMTAPARTIEAQPVTRAANGDAYILLSLANNQALVNIQNELKATATPIEWEDSATFHVTLVYAPGATDLNTIKEVLPKSINPFTFAVGPLDTFDAPDRMPLILRVQPTPALIALQAGLAGSFLALGLELSGYSEPSQWQPHVTLGYLPADAEPPTWDGAATVTGTTLECSIANGGDQFEIIYVTRSKEQTVAQLRDLDFWAKRVKGRNPNTRFTAEFLSAELTEFIRSSLADGWNPAAVFGAAKAAIRDSNSPTLGATPEDYKAYWADFDELDHDLGRSFLEYMQTIADPLVNFVVDHPTENADVSHFLQRGHEALLSSWLGTLDTPGPLLALVLAGLASGDKALARGTTANPHGTTRTVSGAINWSLMSQQSYDFARQYAFDLIKQIDATTTDKVRAAVSQSIAEGWTSEQLRDALSQFINPLFPGQTVEQRAALIGQTESIRAFRSGAQQRWRDAGYTRSKWVTVRQGEPHPVCDICRSLEGQIADFNSGWTSPLNGQTYTNSAHPGCRCFERVVE